MLQTFPVHSPPLTSMVSRGVTPIGAVSTAATGVKMRSSGQGTLEGSVKRSSSHIEVL